MLSSLKVVKQEVIFEKRRFRKNSSNFKFLYVTNQSLNVNVTSLITLQIFQTVKLRHSKIQHRTAIITFKMVYCNPDENTYHHKVNSKVFLVCMFFYELLVFVQYSQCQYDTANKKEPNCCLTVLFCYLFILFKAPEIAFEGKSIFGKHS